MGERGWGRGGDFQAAILQRRRSERLGFQAVMPRLAQRCRPLSPSPSPQKQAFESTLIELAGEPLIQYQTCFKRTCFEGEGSQTFFTYKSHVSERRGYGYWLLRIWRSVLCIASADVDNDAWPEHLGSLLKIGIA
ncbi:hypothetical protein FF011L_21830 [Roseimaritima multifibrata]|uniref:Uncharacterized protein n=1 Tax=Roseimaritima multifibrata TaxID=1930274 RepID=A0A517MEU4_9BACT|nr:hypothetical protein FF011L_21830 [Roseimaritima multifibrata]